MDRFLIFFIAKIAFNPEPIKARNCDLGYNEIHSE